MAGPGGPTVGRVNIRVAPDTSRFRRELGQSLEALERTLTVNIPTRIDTKKVAQDAARVKADVERQLGHVKVGVDVDTKAAAAELARASRDRTSTIRVDVDRSALDRIQGLVGGLTRGLGRITGGAAGIGAIAGAFSTLAAGAAAAVVPVLQLGTALAPAVGILTALPAAAGMAVAAIAPLVIAFQGMGDALGAALSGDAAALAEALEDLTPAAQAVVLAVRDMAPALGDIRRLVQDNFFAPLAEPVAQLGERLLPVLSDGLGGVSVALGISAARLVAFIGEAENLEGLRLLFESTGRAVSTMSDFFPGLLTGFRELGVVGLPFMERFSEVLNEGAIRFGEWATAAADSGEATQWLKEAVLTFQELGAIAGNVGGIIGSIFEGAGGAGLLSTIESITGAFDDFLKSAEGTAALEGIFTGLGDVAGALQPVMGALLEGIGALAPAIGRIAEAFGPVLTRAIEGLVPALLELEPGITSVVEALGKGIEALVDSGALELMGEALSEIMTAVAPLLPVLGELAGVLAGALAEAAIALAPGLATIAEALAESLAPVLPDLADAFTELVEAVEPLIPPLVEALVPILEILPELLLLIAAQMSQWARIIEDLTPAIEILIGGLGWLIDIAVRVINWVLRLATALFNLTEDAEQTAEDIIRAWNNLKERTIAAAQAMAKRIVHWFNDIRSKISSAVQQARQNVSSAFSGIVSAATSRVSTLLTNVRAIPKRIRNALGSLGSLLRTAGRNVIQGLINGITSKLGELRSKMSEVASDVRGALPFSPAKYGPLRTHPPDVAGETITRMIADGLERGRRIVASAAGDVAGSAVLDVEAHPLATPPDTGRGDEYLSRQTDLMERLLEAFLAGEGDVVVQVDSREIARATRAGEREMSRR